jgi:hypothetical protein
MEITKRDFLCGLAGAVILLFILGIFAPDFLRGTFDSMTMAFQKPAPVPVRVRSVVSEWSGSSAFADTDALTDIWNQTRDTAHHDFPFDQGGSDGLAKLLNTEFKHTPTANFTLTADNFDPNGSLKTVAQLISTYTAHVH